MDNATRRALAAVAAPAVAAPAFAAPAFAADPAAPGLVVGTVAIRAHSAALGVGYAWGDGTLRFHGRRYPFAVKGIEVAAPGRSAILGHGWVHGLRKASDFAGTYAASTGEATLANGIGGQALVNGAGAQLRTDNVTRGARLSGAADGIQLTLD